MKTALRWIAGSIFAIATLGSLTDHTYLAALLFMLAGSICLPPVLNWLENSFKFKLQTHIKYITVIVLWFTGIYNMNRNHPKILVKEHAKITIDSLAKTDVVVKTDTEKTEIVEATPDPDMEDRSTMAYIIAKQIIEDRLKAPKSADFPWSPDYSRYNAKKQNLPY